MDGFKERLKRSIEFRLSVWLSSAILIVAIAGGAVSFSTAIDDANELQDETLQQMATLIAQQPALARGLIGMANTLTDSDAKLRVQLLPPGATASTPGRLPLRSDLTDGFQTVEANDESHRVLVKTLDGGARIAVSQSSSVRDEVARDNAIRTVLPMLVLIPILLVVVTALVRRMLKPVSILASEVEGRKEFELHALPEQGLPTEVRPFVLAINSLLQRVALSMETQQRFIADAAHELRSPMTAMSLQAEILDNSGLSPDSREKLGALRRGIERGRSLLNQLLDLARAQSTAAAAPEALRVQMVFRRVLEDVLPLAESKNIDVGVKDGNDAMVRCNEIDLVSIVKNLVENALRYSPEGGHVDLSVAEEGGLVVIEVEDDGPGISIPERERVLDPFYRVLGSDQVGSGLGLAIVQAITKRLHGRVELGDATAFAHGLKVRVLLPAVF